MLKVTIYNLYSLSGTLFTSYEEGICLIKGDGHEYVILCKNLLVLDSFLKLCNSKTGYPTEIRKIKKVNPIFYKKYFYTSKEK